MRLGEVLENLHEYASSIANESKSDALHIEEFIFNVVSGNFLDITIYQYFMVLMIAMMNLTIIWGPFFFNSKRIDDFSLLSPSSVFLIIMTIFYLYFSWTFLWLVLGLFMSVFL